MKTKQFWLMIAGIIVLYLATRLINLALLPIFTDEAIYIRWGQIGLRDASHRFLSLEDGKQPLFVWLMYPMLKIFADPLVAGRMVSVIAGLANLVGLMALAKILFGKKAIIPSGILYVVSPFFLFYDRLALYDSLTTTFAIWALVFQVLMVKTLRVDTALLLGMTVGGGLLTKSSAQFSLFLLPVSLLLFDWRQKDKRQKLARWFGLAVIASIIATLFSWMIKLSPLGHMVAQKNLTFILPFSEFLADPFSRLLGNLRGLTDWLVAYLTWPWVIGGVTSLYFACKKHLRQILLLLAWWLAPFVVLAAFAIVLYPRFILFMTFPLLLILALGLSQAKTIIRNKFLLFTFYFLLFVYPLYFSYTIIARPIDAPLPLADRLQFIDDWPSGYGIKEVVAFARQKATAEPIFIATEGTFGLTPYALTIYLQGTPNIDIKGYWPITDGWEEISRIAQEKTTYILFKDTQEPPSFWPLELIASHRKGKANVFMKLYRVTPP
ncbi:MAG: glycosyltransferase family 39 protein [Candidatus Chisholmbacteria bacterium]|nr:glycosyltransferase family 39 protein [Candidatus Chisholmbacteria bacterium]